MQYLNKKLLIILASFLLLAGCLASEKKLFPYGDWQLATPIKSGYYIYRQFNVDENGEQYLDKIDTSRITSNKGQYRVYGGDDATQVTPTDSDEAYIDFFTTHKRNTYIAQKNDPRYRMFLYSLLDKTDEDSFSIEDKKCSGIKDAFVTSLAKSGVIYGKEGKGEGGYCYFKDRQQLVDVLFADLTTWKSYESRYYEYANPQPVEPKALEKPLLFPYYQGCSKDYSVIPKSYSSAYAKYSQLAGNHLDILSNVSGIELGVEKIDNQLQSYAWIMFSEMCAPQYVIKIISIAPEHSSIKQANIEPDLEKVELACQLERKKEYCGDLDSAIKNYQTKGLKVLLQGYHMIRFRDGKLTEGDLITIMGTEGEAKKMVLLNTNIKHSQGKGATRVLYEYGS